VPTIAVDKETCEAVSTTTALELAAALREIDKRVLLVDRDQVSSLVSRLALAGAR
jgi:cellulose biosynthesis protein BcsQ